MAPTLQQSGYNIVRDDKVLLDAYNNSPPSFVINLFPSHWTLNNGPKFMYNNQVSSILEDIRAFRIPVDFVDVFDRVGVQYYEGCLIVEIVDYRPSKPKDPLLENPDIQRVVCRPNSETIWKDICRLNENHGYKMTDMEALEIEAKILLQTSHPLCLDPDPHLTRIVNNVLRVSTPNIPNSLKRKAASQADLEEDEAEKAKRAKLMQFMNPRAGRAINPTYVTY
ncbi:hypothetical protein SCHPADRAFT_915317 [Schizopora paradoxa]|uniref:Spt20-like SEP domain-containing protein n=1 Tax=Schizopora paradoxa TaxID=27342 RepID=A0A0H2RUW6_9AGAM|nr:hypothetical protein SCHPADRAFT_915317 [Schizopora paradoxa]